MEVTEYTEQNIHTYTVHILYEQGMYLGIQVFFPNCFLFLVKILLKKMKYANE